MFVRRFWFLAILTGLAIVGQPTAKGYKGGELDEHGRGRVGFELYRNYLIVVQGSVGPLKGLNFLFDTGATPSVLDARLAGKLHLATVPTDIAVLNGNVQGETAIVPGVQVGPIRKENVSVLIQDLSFLQKVLPTRIDGIVGLDVFSQDTFVIDYASREIRFGPSPSMPDSVPFHIKEGLGIVDAVINHAPVHLLVDTGASSLILFDEEPVSGSKAAKPSSRTIGDFERRQVRSISLKLGGTEFGHEAAYVVHNHRDAGHDFDGLMSPVALGITRVTVDPARGRLAFTREP